MINRLIVAGFIVSGGLLVSPVIQADQCAYLSEKQAVEALRFLQPASEYVSFCEPCGDKHFTHHKVHKLQELKVTLEPRSITGLEQDYWIISANNRTLDLAYTFVADVQGRFLNLAKLVKCPTKGISTVYSPSPLQAD